MRVVIIGDVIKDIYHRSTKLGVSAETPTIVAHQRKTEVYWGGAALVARHLIELGCDVTLITSCMELEEYPSIPSHFVNSVDAYQLICKERHFVDGYKMLQYDFLQETKHNDNSRRHVIEFAKMHNPDAVIIADNQHGMIDEQLAKEIIKYCQAAYIPSYVDCQVSQKNFKYQLYHGADTVFLNEKEWECVLDEWSCACNEFEQVTDVKECFDWNRLIMKLGARGATLFGEEVYRVDGHEVKSVDTCGAGDAFLAAYVSKGGGKEALEFANKWAAFSTTFIGTVVPSKSDFERSFK